MTPIVSPTTTERILRTLGLTVLFSVFSGWFVYDGFVGYPTSNLKKAVESLDPVPDDLPAIDPRVTDALGKQWIDQVANGRHTKSEVIAQLGPPAWSNADGSEIRYFGPGGMLGFSMSGDLVTEAAFESGEKDDFELQSQKLLGFILAPVAIGFIIQLVRVLTTKVVLSDAGLKVRGRSVIPFESMRSFDATKYRKKGFVDLSYDDGGKERSVRLDDYVIREFRPIIAAICARANLDDPLPEPAQPS